MNTVMYGILQGDFRQAFLANKGVVLISPILIPLITVYIYNWLRDRQVMLNKVTNLVVVYLVVWMIVRNLT